MHDKGSQGMKLKANLCTFEANHADGVSDEQYQDIHHLSHDAALCVAFQNGGALAGIDTTIDLSSCQFSENSAAEVNYEELLGLMQISYNSTCCGVCL